MDVSLNLLRRLLHNRLVVPETIAAHGLAPYRAALDQGDLSRPISGTTFAATATKRNRSGRLRLCESQRGRAAFDLTELTCQHHP